ncbi:MAG: adenosylcobinamide-phosphate synthase CbiB [Bacteroidales bacterium]
MDSELFIIIPLISGLLLDALIGDPWWLPHPVRVFGKAIAVTEQKFNSGTNRKIKGAIITILLILITGVFFQGLIFLAQKTFMVYYPVASILVFYGIANRNLIEEALKANKALKNKGVEAGRKHLSRIVGRDTSNLSENQVRTAILETLAENLSDGVIAPLFYYAIGGIPLMFIYKMVNTIDSMIGYKTEKYSDFGWFAARTDDVLNFVPARITAGMMALITASPRSFVFILKYGSLHSSPNAGYPEAAMAGILNCRFGGPHIYHGELITKPFIGHSDRKIRDIDIMKAIAVNITATVITALLIWVIHTNVTS